MDKEKIDEILEELDFDKVKGEMRDNKYTITLDDSDEYAYYYTLLDSNDDLNLSDASSVSTEYLSIISYEGEDFKVSLNAYYDKDIYTVTIEDLK